MQYTAYMRRFKCKGCGFTKDYWNCDALPFGRVCCSYGSFEEDPAAAIYISSQEILLGSVPTISEDCSPFPPLLVVALQDDMIGQIQIGDSIAVIGHAFTEIKQTLSAQGMCLGQLKVKANNVIHHFNFKSLAMSRAMINFWPDLLFVDDFGCISLNELCRALRTGQNNLRRLDLYSLVALLISLVAGENASNCQIKDRISRKQIHVLLTSTITCETLYRQLQTVAALYSTRSVQHSRWNKNLLPKFSNSSTGGTKVLQSGSLCLPRRFLQLSDVQVGGSSIVRSNA